MNILWVRFEGISKREILEGLGYIITAKGNLSYKGELQVAHDGSPIEAKDVLAVVPAKEKGKMRLITDIGELEEEE